MSFLAPFVLIVCFILRVIIEEKMLLLSFLVILIIFFIVYFYYQISNFFTFVSVDINQLKVYQLLKFRIKTFQLEEISGYSLSEMYFGNAPSLFKSKSFVIYPKKTKPFEVIQLFNLNFNNVLSEIKRNNITKFGFEPYVTGWFIRKYKFGYLIK